MINYTFASIASDINNLETTLNQAQTNGWSVMNIFNVDTSSLGGTWIIIATQAT